MTQYFDIKGVVMDLEKPELEILDEGKDDTEIVPTCCTGGTSVGRV